MYPNQPAYGGNQQHMQMQPLPVSFEVRQFPLLNVGPEAPPCVPHVVAPPELFPAVGFIAGALAAEVQQNCEMNPIRRFLFNLLAQNSYQNEFFQRAVEITTNMIAITPPNSFPDFPSCVFAQVRLASELLAAANVERFPALGQILDQNTRYNINNAVGEFNNIIAKLAQFNPTAFGGVPAQQMQYGNPGGGNGGYTQYGPNGQPMQMQYAMHRPQGPGTGMAMQAGSSGVFGTRIGHIDQGAGNKSSTWSRGGRARYVPPELQATEASVVAPAPGPAVFATPATDMRGITDRAEGGHKNDRFSRFRNVVEQPHEAKDISMQPPIHQAPASIATDVAQPAPETAIAELPDLLFVQDNYGMWHPSKERPYFFGFKPSEMTAVFAPMQNGTIQQLAVSRESNMDYEKHTTIKAFGAVPQAISGLLNSGNALEKIADGAKELNDENKSAEGPDPMPIVLTRKQAIMRPTLSQAWYDAAVSRLSTGNETPPDVYRAFAIVAYPSISSIDETDALRSFGQSTSLYELRDKLVQAAKEMDRGLWMEVNRVMTDAVNRALKFNLSLPDLSIDSFADDIQDLVKVLGDPNGVYGKDVQDAFLDHENELIDCHIRVLSGEFTEGLTASDFDIPDGSAAKITYLASCVSLTLLDSMSFELDVELIPNLGTAVLEDTLPEFSALIEQIFESADQYTNGTNGQPIARYLIRTSDGRVLEAFKGWLGRDFKLLALCE